MGKNLAEESSITALLGSWISAMVMIPFGIFLTRRATKDKGLFNIDAIILPIKNLFIKFKSKKRPNKNMTALSNSNKTQLNDIAAAIEDVRNGKIIIVVDDENRENEGDFLAAAEKATPEMINFMATHGRGLICAPLTERRCAELELGMMVNNNTDPMETGFTVSVDLRGKGVTTGISASDRALTIKALIDTTTNHLIWLVLDIFFL